MNFLTLLGANSLKMFGIFREGKTKFSKDLHEKAFYRCLVFYRNKFVDIFVFEKMKTNFAPVPCKRAFCILYYHKEHWCTAIWCERDVAIIGDGHIEMLHRVSRLRAGFVADVLKRLRPSLLL